MNLKQVNHVGIRTKDVEKLGRFYAEVLGLTPHPEKRNWLKVGESNTVIHLMPVNGSTEGNDTSDYARHVCLEAESLEEVVTTLLARGIKPFQCEIDATKRRELTDAGDLTFGIGTIFITDPEGNVIEFMQADRGVFAKYHFEHSGAALSLPLADDLRSSALDVRMSWGEKDRYCAEQVASGRSP